MEQSQFFHLPTAAIIGRPLDKLALMPLSFDEKEVRQSMSRPTLAFSGAIHLGVGMRNFYVSWRKKEPYGLDVSDQLSWNRDAVTAISVSEHPSWSDILDQEISALQTLCHRFAASVPIAIRIILGQGDRKTTLWIGTGGEDGLFEAEELWVGMDVMPRNYSDLIVWQGRST